MVNKEKVRNRIESIELLLASRTVLLHSCRRIVLNGILKMNFSVGVSMYRANVTSYW